MPLLSEEEKEEIRQSLIEPNEEILSETATILRQSEVPDDYGGTMKTFAALAQTEPCMISKVGAPERYTDEPHGGGVGPQQLWKISFLDTVELLPTDRCQIGARVFEMVNDPGLGTYTILNRVVWKEVKDE